MLQKIKENILNIFCFIFGFAKQKSVILAYHSISDKNNFFAVSPEDFEKQVKWLKDSGFVFLDLFLALSAGNGLGQKPGVLITFDDGYRDNFSNALPILEKYNIPAIFFISCGLIEKEISGLKMMSWVEIKKISEKNLFKIASHGINHIRLTNLSEEELRGEIFDSKKIIEEKIGEKINYFSYPFGRFSGKIIDNLKKAGYEFGFSIIPYFLPKKIKNKFILPRISVDKNSADLKNFKQIFNPGFSYFWKLRRVFLKKDKV